MIPTNWLNFTISIFAWAFVQVPVQVPACPQGSMKYHSVAHTQLYYSKNCYSINRCSYSHSVLIWTELNFEVYIVSINSNFVHNFSVYVIQLYSETSDKGHLRKRDNLLTKDNLKVPFYTYSIKIEDNLFTKAWPWVCPLFGSFTVYS